jgi:tetratricopeptide (TPR) repeat protein
MSYPPSPPRRNEGVEDRLAAMESSLRTIAQYFSPKEEAKRVGRLRKAVMVGGSWVAVVGGGMIGSWELISFLIERAEVRATANAYATVADRLYFEDNNPEAALAFVDKSLEILPNDPDHLRLRSFIDGLRITKELSNRDRPLTQDEVDGAFAAKGEADLLVVLDPHSSQGHFLTGQIYAALAEETDVFGDGAVDPEMSRRAEVALRRAFELQPDNTFTLVRIAQVEAQRGDLDAAIATLDEAIGLDPSSKWALLWTGVLRWARFSWDGEAADAEAARAALVKAIEIDRRFDLAWLNLAKTRIYEPEFRELGTAREGLRRALAINPDLHEAMADLSYTWGLEKRYEIGLAYIDRAVELDPLRVRYRLDRAVLLGELARWDEALADLDAARSLDPARIDIQQQRGRVLRELQRFGEAIDALEFAREADPESVRTLLYLAATYEQAGEPARAVAVLDVAIADPESLDEALGDALAARGRCRQAMGDLEGAAADLDAAIEADPTAANLLYRGRLRREQGRVDDALADLRAAQRARDAQRDDLLAACREDALLSEERGDLPGALAAIDRYLDVDPSSEEAKAIRDRLRTPPAPPTS